MGIRGVDHIVVRVKDIDEGIATYRETLGMELERTAQSEAIGIKQAFFPLADGGFLEVVAPLGAETPVGRAIERRGEGVHTIAVAVDDLEQTIKDLREKGAQLIEADRPGGQVFIHPRSTHGVLIQLVERS
ncbi:MAG: VOC family protein [Myxococcota bacterium]